MRGTKKSKDEWRDEFIKPDEFKCACGCALQLSKGDLDDAVKCALPFGGRPRTYGVRLTRFEPERKVKSEPPEPTETQPCPKCGDPVELPVFAAKLLTLKASPWPTCADCKSPTKQSNHSAREYWE